MPRTAYANLHSNQSLLGLPQKEAVKDEGYLSMLQLQLCQLHQVFPKRCYSSRLKVYKFWLR